MIKEYMESEGYLLSDASRFSHSLDAFHYNYQNAGGNRDMIKIELNYSLRAHVFEPVYRSILPSAIDMLDFNKIRRDLFPVLNKKDNFQLDERKKIAKEYIENLMILTAKEQEYLDNFEKKKYIPELLFDDADIVKRIKNHPMALWKCKE